MEKDILYVLMVLEENLINKKRQILNNEYPSNTEKLLIKECELLESAIAKIKNNN